MLIEVPEWQKDILEEHYDELESLLNRRLRAHRSADMDAVGLERIDTRIEAHLDAMVLADEHAWPFIERALGTKEPVASAAAAMAIASADVQSLEQQLVETFATSPAPALDGLRAVLELRAGERLRGALATLVLDAAPRVASAACAVAVAHDLREAARVQRQWLEDDDPQVRRLAWMIEARIAHHDRGRLRSSDWRLALGDQDRDVRRAALWAAARSGQRWLLDHLRSAAANPRPDALDEHWLLAVLGDAVDLPLILTIGQAKILGWDRFRVLAACGCAPAVEELLRVMHHEAPLDGACASDAFFRITGVRVDRPERVALVEPGAEPDELADDVRMCDPEAASRAWSTLKGRMGPLRWVRGVQADVLPVDDLPKTLDLEARWGLQLRAAWAGFTVLWDTERFPFG